MAKPLQVTVIPSEASGREARRHRSRLANLRDAQTAQLATRVAADPTLEDRLAPQQLVALGLFRGAVESREWLRANHLEETP